MAEEALAFWVREPGVGEIRAVPVPEPRPGEVLVRAVASGVSRGTEALVFDGPGPREPARHDAGALPGR